MKAVAACLALLLTIQCAAGYSGFIRTSGEKFVDDNCEEFIPLGMNTYVLHLQLLSCCTLVWHQCSFAECRVVVLFEAPTLMLTALVCSSVLSLPVGACTEPSTSTLSVICYLQLVASRVRRRHHR